ncbi:hypothetical protein BC941DRAFT_473630 [Chlamydoabsidia padenii]|nr:hypothetical protein BC941DRAFT_473630 [Chlamydoabsidia padenii]
MDYNWQTSFWRKPEQQSQQLQQDRSFILPTTNRPSHFTDAATYMHNFKVQLARVKLKVPVVDPIGLEVNYRIARSRHGNRGDFDDDLSVISSSDRSTFKKFKRRFGQRRPLREQNREQQQSSSHSHQMASSPPTQNLLGAQPFQDLLDTQQTQHYSQLGHQQLAPRRQQQFFETASSYNQRMVNTLLAQDPLGSPSTQDLLDTQQTQDMPDTQQTQDMLGTQDSVILDRQRQYPDTQQSDKRSTQQSILQTAKQSSQQTTERPTQQSAKQSTGKMDQQSIQHEFLRSTVAEEPPSTTMDWEITAKEPRTQTRSSLTDFVDNLQREYFPERSSSPKIEHTSEAITDIDRDDSFSLQHDDNISGSLALQQKNSSNNLDSASQQQGNQQTNKMDMEGDKQTMVNDKRIPSSRTGKASTSKSVTFNDQDQNDEKVGEPLYGFTYDDTMVVDYMDYSDNKNHDHSDLTTNGDQSNFVMNDNQMDFTVDGHHLEQGSMLSRHRIDTHDNLSRKLLNRKSNDRKLITNKDLKAMFMSALPPNIVLKPESMRELEHVTDCYLDQLCTDLTTLADHAGDKVIDKDHIELQRLLDSGNSLEALAHEHLPRELWDEICVSAMSNNYLYPKYSK